MNITSSVKILIIDNYDSFTFNLVHLFAKFTSDITVVRNDKITLKEIIEINPSVIVISPGPGRPEDSKICIPVVQKLKGKIPILGICLGHQVIGHLYGAKVTGASELVHGKSSKITHCSSGIFRNIPQGFEAGRYHSLIISEEYIPGELEITARTDDDLIMGIRHKELPLEGIQFHPESVLTPMGEILIGNWLGNSLQQQIGIK